MGIGCISADGGLTAELGFVTIKIHEDTIKQLLLDAVDASSEEPSIKELLKAKIKSGTVEMLSRLLTEDLRKGLSQMPNAALCVDCR